MSDFFAVKIVDGGDVSYALTGAGYGLIIAVMLALLIIANFLVSPGQKGRFQTKHLVFCAMAVALATVTSMIKFQFPLFPKMGGSITLLSMLFICLTGYWYGLRTGLMTAFAYGCLQLILDPFIISLPQVFFDYFFAFGALGLSGAFCRAKHGLAKGYLLGVCGRYFFSFLSGIIFFGMYAGDYGMSAPVYSFLYQGSYLVPEAAATLAVISVPAMKKALERVKGMAQ